MTVPWGVPTDDELAAIVAAVEMTWPRPLVAVDDEPHTVPAWRFSGRWWAGPTPLRRQRPWS